MSRQVVSLLTDYGPHSEHVGALHAVLVRECRGVERVDLAHDIPAGDVAWGGIVLARLAALLPGAVHLAVVDPGVGTDRAGVAVRLRDGGALVGPDNGLLGAAAAALGATAAVRLAPPADGPATFHGRDVFAPAAARLASGDALDLLGTRLPVDALATAPLPQPVADPGRLVAASAGRDRFGNLAVAATAEHLAAAGIGAGDRVRVLARDAALTATVARTFADVPAGTGLVFIDSHGHVAVALNMGDAATRLGVRRSGTRVELLREAGPPTV